MNLKCPALIWLPSARAGRQPGCRKWCVKGSEEKPFVKDASCNLLIWYLSNEEEERGLFYVQTPKYYLVSEGSKAILCWLYVWASCSSSPVTHCLAGDLAVGVPAVTLWRVPDSEERHSLPWRCPRVLLCLWKGSQVRGGWKRTASRANVCVSHLVRNSCYWLKFICTPLVSLDARPFSFLLIQHSASKTKKSWCFEQVLQLAF